MTFQATAVAIQTGNPIHIQGDPGVGKSALINLLAKECEKHLETRIASLCDPTDFAGLPMNDGNGGVVYAAPRWAMNLTAHGGGLLFLDEIGGAPPTVQMGLMRVCLDKVVGDHELPKDDTWVVACSNPTDQTPGGFDFAPPLANRFCHLPWEFSPETWITGMTSDFPIPSFPMLPDDWKSHIPESRAMVASFAKARPEMISSLPKEESLQAGAWPSPRSWTVAAEMLAAVKSIDGKNDILTELIAGCVGNGAGLEFVNFLNELDLPDPKEVLAAGKKYKLPKAGDKQFAILNSATSYAIRSIECSYEAEDAIETWNQIWAVLEGAADQGAVDVAAGVCPNLVKCYENGMEQGIDLPLVESAIEAFIPMLAKSGILKSN